MVFFMINKKNKELLWRKYVKQGDVVIEILAEEAFQKGYQVLSFDLPEHGERKSDNTPCKVQFCVSDLSVIMNYAKGKDYRNSNWSKAVLGLFLLCKTTSN